MTLLRSAKALCTLHILVLHYSSDAFISRSACRHQTHLPSTKEAISQPSKPINKKQPITKWITCHSSNEVTQAIQQYVNQNDTVAELGSQLRDSSNALCENIGSNGTAILVDVERKFPNRKDESRTLAMRRDNELECYTDRATFVEIPSFDLWREALFFRGKRMQYNVFVLDMSAVAGNDLELTCISLIREFLALNHRTLDQDGCRVVIVKSASLNHLARRLFHAQRIISGVESVKSCGRQTTAIIGAVGVKQYRDTIPFIVEKGDVCVEVGCHLGTTTTLINEAAMNGDIGGCIGVDVGSHIIKSAREKYPHVAFEVGDGFKTGALARMRVKHFGNDHATSYTNDDRIYDVVYVDIGGLSGSEGLLDAVSLLSSICNSLNPRCVVIKSLCIRRLASCLVPFSNVWR